MGTLIDPHDPQEERVFLALRRLQLTHLRDTLAAVLSEAAKEQWTYLEFLDWIPGRRERVENTKALRKRVLEVAGCIREARQNIDAEIRVSPQHWQCRVCGQRSRCSQAR